jgi:hypothetical protein
MELKHYIDKKIEDILHQRTIEKKWTEEVLEYQKELRSKFNLSFDKKFLDEIKKLITILDQNKEFEDLISLNKVLDQSKIVVCNQFSEVKLYLNYETKNIEIAKISRSGVAVYDFTKNGIENAKKDFVDEIINEFQYASNPKEKEFVKIQRFKSKFGKKNRYYDEDSDLPF